MIHVEWDVAETCDISAMTAADAEEELRPGEGINAPFVVVLGGDGGGCLAVEGTREELIKFGQRVVAAGRALRYTPKQIKAGVYPLWRRMSAGSVKVIDLDATERYWAGRLVRHRLAAVRAGCLVQLPRAADMTQWEALERGETG